MKVKLLSCEVTQQQYSKKMIEMKKEKE